jgi:hypothetical protein
LAVAQSPAAGRSLAHDLSDVIRLLLARLSFELLLLDLERCDLVIVELVLLIDVFHIIEELDLFAAPGLHPTVSHISIFNLSGGGLCGILLFDYLFLVIVAGLRAEVGRDAAHRLDSLLDKKRYWGLLPHQYLILGHGLQIYRARIGSVRRRDR